MDSPELREGSEGEWVVYLQGHLRNAGYDAGSTSGEFDSELTESVRRYRA